MTAATGWKYEELAQRAEALQIVLESLPTGIVVADADGRLLFCNPAAEKILGTSVTLDAPDAWTSIYGWYLPDQVTVLPPERLPLTRAIRGEEVIDELVFVRNFERPAGVWIRINGWPLQDPSGLVSGGFVMFNDFTQGREAMQTLVLLSRVVEQTADSVVLTDTQGVIQYVNPAFEATTGYGKEEALGKTPRILKSGLHDAEFYRQLWARITEGQPSKGMIINRKKTGELYWAQQTITPMRDESGQLTNFVSVSQDVTELRRKQEQEFQLQLASDVQRRFYAAPPSIPGFDIGAASHPAYETGGDYFDFISMADGSLAIAVGDVAGHGFGSALIMALTRAYLRSFVSMQLAPDEVLAQVNRVLLHDLEQGQYVTLCIARLDPHLKTLSYASAAHVPGCVIRESGDLKHTLDSSGPPLGLFSESTFFLQPLIRLDPGEMVVLLTDGIAESASQDGNQFGAQRVLDYIRSHSHDSAQQIANGIYQAVRAYVKHDPQDDDITSVVIKVDSST